MACLYYSPQALVGLPHNRVATGNHPIKMDIPLCAQVLASTVNVIPGLPDRGDQHPALPRTPSDTCHPSVIFTTPPLIPRSVLLWMI